MSHTRNIHHTSICKHQSGTYTQTQPQSIASTPTAYEPPQLVVIPPNTTVKRTTQASPPLRAHDRNINGLKCKKLESHCKSISCLMKDIFAHSKEKNESFRWDLKQVNFLFARLLTRRVLANKCQCQWCSQKPIMTKKQALLHMNTSHGNLLKKTEDPREMTQCIKGLEAKATRRNCTAANNYPCPATNCDFVAKDPRTTHLHQIVGHRRPIKDKNCYL
jgi:hypothetical protein